MENKTLNNKKKNISFLGLRLYAEKLGYTCIRYKKENKNGKAYNWYDIVDKNHNVIFTDRYPKVIKEKLEIIEKFSNIDK